MPTFHDYTRVIHLEFLMTPISQTTEKSPPITFFGGNGEYRQPFIITPKCHLTEVSRVVATWQACA